ncbi:MAG: hypothetical protein HFG31_00395 [Eubacterium sp.]|nr:hypothetical protein [Eubacterium sp.]
MRALFTNNHKNKIWNTRHQKNMITGLSGYVSFWNSGRLTMSERAF